MTAALRIDVQHHVATATPALHETVLGILARSPALAAS